MTTQEKIAVEKEGNRRFGRLPGEGYDASDLFEAYINGAEFLSELRSEEKPKDATGQDVLGRNSALPLNDTPILVVEEKPSEDLVEQIIETLDEYSYIDEFGFKHFSESVYREVATEIAKLVSSSRRQENDAEPTVMVKDVKSELASLQSFILLNLPSDTVDDYHFPNSTSRKTIRVVMDIIRKSNERFRSRVRKSIAILEANKYESK